MTDFLARLLTRGSEQASFRPRIASRFEIAVSHAPTPPEALDLPAEDDSAEQAVDNLRTEIVHSPSEEEPARARRFVPPSSHPLPTEGPSAETDRPETSSERPEHRRSTASIEDSLAQLRGDLDLLSRRRDGRSSPTGRDFASSRPSKRNAEPSLDHVSTTQVSSRPRRRRQIEDRPLDGLEVQTSISAVPSVAGFLSDGARAALPNETTQPSAQRSLGVRTEASPSPSTLEPTLKPTAIVRRLDPPIRDWQSPLHTQALPLSPEPEPTVHVTIGRIEVRAVSNDPPARRERKRSPQMTLEEYLRRRSEVAR